MKHIRLFEGFSNDEYYTKIDTNTYNELLSDTINMTNKDISIITKDLKYEWDEDIVGRIPGVKDIRSKVLVIFPESGSLTINKLDDEWFIVRITSIKNVDFTKAVITDSGKRYDPELWLADKSKYKCDQIEGLLMLLKDKDYLK
jgi:hypothetical protein